MRRALPMVLAVVLALPIASAHGDDAGFRQRTPDEAPLDDADLLAADVDERATEDEEQQEQRDEDGGDDEDDERHGSAFLGRRRGICDDANDTIRCVAAST